LLLKIKTKNMADIRINVTIKTAPKNVYSAVTTQEGLAGWWNKQAIAKPEVGFVNVFTFGQYRNEMEVIELSSDKKVEWKIIDSIDEWVGTHVSFDLQEKGGNTVLRFAHSGWKSVTDTFAVCTYDWSKFLASLKSLCETGSGTPA
jgi:uncharacterized protein YndB with AHSA1/START domain